MRNCDAAARSALLLAVGTCLCAAAAEGGSRPDDLPDRPDYEHGGSGGGGSGATRPVRPRLSNKPAPAGRGLNAGAAAARLAKAAQAARELKRGDPYKAKLKKERSDIFKEHMAAFEGVDSVAWQALLDDKAVLLEFFAPWCAHCREFEPEYKKTMDALKAMPKFAEHMYAMQVDMSKKKEHKNIILTFGVNTLPSVWFIGVDLVQEFKGERDTYVLVDWVKNMLVKVGKLEGDPVDEDVGLDMKRWSFNRKLIHKIWSAAKKGDIQTLSRRILILVFKNPVWILLGSTLLFIAIFASCLCLCMDKEQMRMPQRPRPPATPTAEGGRKLGNATEPAPAAALEHKKDK